MTTIRPARRLLTWLGVSTSVTGSVALLLVTGHFLLGALSHVDSALRPRSHLHPAVDSPVFDGFPDKVEFWEEHGEAVARNRLEPYYHWRHAGFSGRFINVSDNGLRKTVKQPAPDSRSVFVFGGSSIWGFGARDEDTIPSLLQARLGPHYDVHNFGQLAFVSAQEVALLLQRLAMGDVPDLVIFYDGANDGAAGTYQPAIPRHPQKVGIRSGTVTWKGIASEIYEKSSYARLIGRLSASFGPLWRNESSPWEDRISHKIEDNGRSVVLVYEAHIKQVKALGREYGFDAFFFWQPNLFSMTRKLSASEDRILSAASRVWRDSQTEVYRKAMEQFSDRERENVFFLGNLFDDEVGPVYVDWVHTGRRGNDLAASAIYNRIRARIDAQ